MTLVKLQPKVGTYFPKHSAGREMTTAVVAVTSHATMGEIVAVMKDPNREFETVNYVYVLDDGKLMGVISVKEVLHLAEKEVASDVMERNIVSVRAYTDHEKAALLAISSEIKAIPVIDKENNLMGVIPPDVIMRIIHSELTEDILRSAGVDVGDKKILDVVGAPASIQVRRRLPWLLLGLLGGVLAAFIIGFFEHTLETQLLLASFIPAVAYMADAVGNQAQTLLIRSMSLNQSLKIKDYVSRELIVGLSLSAILGFIFATFLYLGWGSFVLGLIIGLSLFFTILIATGVGLFLPWMLSKHGYDPAIATGPFATLLRDIISLSIYFGIANLILFF